MNASMIKDFRLVTIIGFLVGWLVLVPAANLGYRVTLPLAAGSVVFFSLFAPFALFILKLLSRRWRIFEQFGKFAAVGTLNALIDLAVLNFLILISGFAAGWYYVLFKAASFVIASTNSYLWNKFWTFGSRTKASLKEFLAFIAFTLVGTAINVGVASLLVNAVGAPAGIGLKWWANISAVIAIFAGLLWNFTSYRKVVFREPKKEVL